VNCKIFAKFSRYCCLGILSLGIVLFLGCIAPTKWYYRAQAGCTYPIYISSVQNFHAEIIVPVVNDAFDWRSHLTLSQLGPNAENYRYLSFGWGDRKFYMNGSLDPISIFDALFLPSPTVMHIWGHTEEPSQWSKDFEIKQVRLNHAQYLKLMQFISESFQHTAQGSVRYIHQGLYADSGFYEAVGSYSILRTCNTWTADALKQADVDTPVWSATAPAIMQHLHSNCGIPKYIGKI
jgi:uncharacterized protein (TIGR02117 family)